MICSWDRPGLLAKIAAAFTALRLNILQADVYTRADHVALDVFHVCERQEPHTTKPARLQDLIFLLEGSLSDPPRFVSVWAGQFHKALPRPALSGTSRIEFDTGDPSEYTVLRVETTDRLGLLCDLLQVLTSRGINIAEAIVQTDGDRVSDVLYLTDSEGAAIYDPVRLATIRKALLQAIHG
jgi:[protein-PII] uridylyltransferase